MRIMMKHADKTRIIFIGRYDVVIVKNYDDHGNLSIKYKLKKIKD
jgi:hypothetical protein